MFSCKKDSKKEDIIDDLKVKSKQVVDKKKSVTLEDHLASGLRNLENSEDVDILF